MKLLYSWMAPSLNEAISSWLTGLCCVQLMSGRRRLIYPVEDRFEYLFDRLSDR